jgi:transcription antitermination factor NusG
VLQILGTDELSAIPDEEIAALRRLVDSPAPLERVPYVAGSSVTVEGGSWAGQRGIVERTRGNEFATIRMLIFGRDTPVEIAVADLKAL